MIGLRKGLHSILAEAILISVLLTSIAVLDVFHGRVSGEAGLDKTASLTPVGCLRGLAILILTENGHLYVERGAPLEIKVYRDGVGWSEIPETGSAPILARGDLVVLKFYEAKGFARVGDFLVYYDGLSASENCLMVRVE